MFSGGITALENAGSAVRASTKAHLSMPCMRRQAAGIHVVEGWGALVSGSFEPRSRQAFG
ncbi:MAG TPA: hypothetical protein VJB99_01525 [Patescibacteria group bacterium]|nr:hypothetical protein [Patescibacteria group bacterium]